MALGRVDVYSTLETSCVSLAAVKDGGGTLHIMSASSAFGINSWIFASVFDGVSVW